MASTYTNTLELELQAAGDNSGTWGDPTLNQNVFTRIDAWAGTTTTVALVSSNVTLTQTQWRSACIKLTGALGANVEVRFPLNVNSATVAVGGTRIIDNQCTGNFTVTVKTIAVGSTGVVVPQSVRSFVYSDTANVTFADDRLGTTDISRIPSCAGSPNGAITGVAGTAFKPASTVFDRTNKITYASSADGTAGWVPQSGYFPPPACYLTLVSTATDPINPVPTSDVTAATTVYCRPFGGNMMPVYDGSWVRPYFYNSQLQLDLTSSQAASQIYDIFAFIDSATLIIGTGPAWATPTAGSGARGTGAGTTQLSLVNGLLVNTVAMTARNGASTYSVSANQGTYLSSIFMDGTNGQVSCYRSYGASRKWGLWNLYNQQDIILKAGNGSGSWPYGTNTFRPSNALTDNSFSTFTGIAGGMIEVDFIEGISVNSGTTASIGIGWNSTTVASGYNVGVTIGTAIGTYWTRFQQTQATLGVNVVTGLERATSSATFQGLEAGYLLSGKWRG